MSKPELLCEGHYIDLMVRDTWEYTARKNITGIVGIVPLTDDGKIVLCEQYRPPVNKNVIELPAGLVGDEGDKDESLATAAERELLEETGYEAGEMKFLFEGATSPGVTDEILTIFMATNLKKTGDGGGVGSEDITVHEVPIDGLVEWLDEQKAAGKLVDMKIYSVLHFCK
jgi:ADP-ribose pyrophosphatase